MRNPLKIVPLVLILIAAALTACDDREEKQVFKRMERHSKALRSLRADFTQSAYESTLNDTVTRRGRLTYLVTKDDVYLRIDFEKPQESVALVNDRYAVYQPGLKIIHTGRLKGETAGRVSSGLAFLKFSKERLLADFDVDYRGREKLDDGLETFHLVFRPKRKTFFETAEIWPDEDGMPRLMKVVMPNTDSQTVRFTNIQKNEPVKAADFRITPAPGTKIVKDD